MSCEQKAEPVCFCFAPKQLRKASIAVKAARRRGRSKKKKGLFGLGHMHRLYFAASSIREGHYRIINLIAIDPILSYS